MKILFLCRENVGRSQVAEACFTKLATDKSLPHQAHSAGTHANTYEHFGKPLRELVIKTLAEQGIDWSTKVSKQLTEEVAKDADKIIMMAEPELLPEYLKNDPRIEIWQTPDMKYEDLEFHRKTYDMIKSKIEQLLDNISAKSQ